MLYIYGCHPFCTNRRVNSTRTTTRLWCTRQIDVLFIETQIHVQITRFHGTMQGQHVCTRPIRTNVFTRETYTDIFVCVLKPQYIEQEPRSTWLAIN